MIPGVILAAGRSSRMGRSKALLPLPDDTTFVARLAATLLAGGVADVLVVGRPDDQPLREEVDRQARGVRFVENPHAERGQLSSLLAGLNAADHPGIHAVLVAPVDLPLIQPATVTALLEAFRSTRPAIARATHTGRHGHPVVFGRSVFEALRRARPESGARGVVHTHPVLNVEVPDPAVLQDVDTPDDYARLFN